MTSKQIAVKYLAPNISNPAMIFTDINIFKSILPWARDSAREYFATQKSKMFLLDYIDEVGHVVDEYLLNRVTKMYKKAIKSQNKLFSNLCSSKKTISWLIDRWINTFINLTSNPNYREYIDISKIKIALNDEISTINRKIEDILEFEKIKKIPKNELINKLKEVWKDAIYDDFDEEDMKYLCEKLSLRLDEVFKNKGDLFKLNLKKEQVLNGGSQLVLLF